MLEAYFSKYKANTVGSDLIIQTPYGAKKMYYADWIASGRLYAPIEEHLVKNIGPYVGNTHTGTNVTGETMTRAYHESLKFIKKHVNADKNDVIISTASGMTGVVTKFQRIIGLKLHEKFRNRVEISDEEKPVVFVTHMEHHSNQTSWLETIADVIVIPPTNEGKVDLNALKKLLDSYIDKRLKIAAITSYSNVTGVKSPYYEIAELMHQNNGYCFVDFAASAPYIDVNMHPGNEAQKLDAIFFSPHKFLGGPAGTGILVFDSRLYNNKIPDVPGGGTVEWTNPWGGHAYVKDIESREDGGTPAFLQTIKVALALSLKAQMGVENILKREKYLLEKTWHVFDEIPNLKVLAGNIRERLGIVSFYIDDLHFNLAVRLLNDKFGIQVRGGCSCAGTYGHILLNVSADSSERITTKITEGDLSEKPGWIRLSLHPTMSDADVDYILNGIKDICKNHILYKEDYSYNAKTNEFTHKDENLSSIDIRVENWINQVF